MESAGLQILRDLLDQQGVNAGLAYLNSRVPYRFTAIYTLHGEAMRNTHFFDRVGGFELGELREVPLTDSFCQFVLRDGLFVTNDSGGDARLDGHPYQGVVVSYVGLPLTDASGELVGTFCHLDLVSHPVDDAEFAFLQQVAQLLPSFLPPPAGAL